MLKDKQIVSLAKTVVGYIEFCVGGSVRPLTERVGSPFSGHIEYRPNSFYSPGRIFQDFCSRVDFYINNLKKTKFFRSFLNENKDLMIKAMEMVKTMDFWHRFYLTDNVERILIHYCYCWTKVEYWDSPLSGIYGYGKEKMTSIMTIVLTGMANQI